MRFGTIMGGSRVDRAIYSGLWGLQEAAAG
jgi:hypothetical protein